MKLQFGRLFRRLGLPFWTFIGIALAGVFVNYIGSSSEIVLQDVLQALGITEDQAQKLSPFLVLLFAVVTVVMLAAWQGRRRAPANGRFGAEPLPKPVGKRGLILLVSRTESAMYAIQYHYRDKGTLEYVWLIPSNDLEKDRFGHKSTPEAENIKTACEKLKNELGRPLEVMPWRDGVSPADAQDTYDAVNRVYRIDATRINLEPGDIIADFTGGTKPMSVGMIMACLPAERSLQYVAFNQDTKTMSGPFLIDYQHSAFDLIG